MKARSPRSTSAGRGRGRRTGQARTAAEGPLPAAKSWGTNPAGVADVDAHVNVAQRLLQALANLLVLLRPLVDHGPVPEIRREPLLDAAEGLSKVQLSADHEEHRHGVAVAFYDGFKELFPRRQPLGRLRAGLHRQVHVEDHDVDDVGAADAIERVAGRPRVDRVDEAELLARHLLEPRPVPSHGVGVVFDDEDVKLPRKAHCASKGRLRPIRYRLWASRVKRTEPCRRATASAISSSPRPREGAFVEKT